MNRAERRAQRPMKRPDYPEVRMPPTPGLRDGDLVTITQGSHHFLGPKTKDPQVFQVKVTG